MNYYLGLTLMSLLPFFSVNNHKSKIEWNQKELTFEDFKGESKYSGEKVKGEFAGLIKWSYSITNDNPPQYTIYNKMDREKSWISANSEELISEYQFMWDLQELYARKMRKASEDLNQQNVQDTKVYRDTFNDYVKKLQSEKGRYTGMIYNQPDFKKILTEQYKDSLELYDKYKLD